MVEASLCRMRLQEYADISGGILAQLPLEVRAMKPKLLKLHITGTPADAIGFSEISAPTNILTAAVAVAIEHLSGDALDKNLAGGAVRSYNSIGIDGDDEIVNRTEEMDAADGTTETATTNLYKECFHAFGNLWGTTDKDAEGQIDIRKLDDTILVSILITKNESNGSRFLVPDNHVCMLFGGRFRRLTDTVDEGNRFRIVYVDAIDGLTGLVAADRLNNWIEFIISGVTGSYEANSIDIPKGHMFTSGTWITFQHSSHVNLGEPYDLELEFLIWKK